MGKGPIFLEHQGSRVECPECGVEVAALFLLIHFQSQHRVGGETGVGVSPPPPRVPPGESQTYLVSFPKHLSQLRYQVAGCLGGSSSRTNLQIHFAHRHMWDTIVILEEGNRP